MYFFANKKIGADMQWVLIISQDAGATWGPPIPVGDPGFAAYAFGFDICESSPNVMYGSGYWDDASYTYYPRVWRSDDGGYNWTNVTGNLFDLTGPYGLIVEVWVSPDNPDYVLASTSSTLYQTTDGGVTWAANSLGMGVTSFVYHPGVDILYAGTGNGVYKSEDQGATWTAINNGLASLKVQALDLDLKDGYLYAGTYGGSINRLDVAASPLWGNYGEISQTAGGTVDFNLDAGAANGNRNYLILAGVTGTSPGTVLPGGYATLPLNWDVFTDFALSLVNSPVFSKFMGKLDANGQAAAQLYSPPLPPIALGVKMYYAYCCNNFFDYVSNPIDVMIVD